MASEEVQGSFCHYDACIITDQLAIGLGALERELLIRPRPFRTTRTISLGLGRKWQSVR